MKINLRGSKLFIALKIFLSICLISVTCSAYAEYYFVVQGGCGGGCCGCYTPPPPPCFGGCFRTCNMRFVSPPRHNPSGSSQVAEYEWVGDP